MRHTVEVELAAELTLRARDVAKLDHRIPALAARLAAFDGLLERFHLHMTWGEQAPSNLIYHHLFFDVTCKTQDGSCLSHAHIFTFECTKVGCDRERAPSARPQLAHTALPARKGKTWP